MQISSTYSAPAIAAAAKPAKRGGLAGLFAALGAKQEPEDKLVDALVGVSNYDQYGQVQAAGQVSGKLLDVVS